MFGERACLSTQSAAAEVGERVLMGFRHAAKRSESEPTNPWIDRPSEARHRWSR